jgi:hypothetical protein
MAFLAAAAPFLLAASTAVGAAYAIKSGQDQKLAAENEAAQMDAQAKAEQASGQRAYLTQQRQTQMVSSRAQALAASSGAGVSDPTVANIISGIQGEGEYQALSSLYQGDVTAKGLQYGANVRRSEGDAAAKAGYLRAASTVLSGVGSMYYKYGAGGPPSSRSSLNMGAGWGSGSGVIPNSSVAYG